MAKDQYADFMAQAYSMELEATERYAQFAEQLDTHNNREVADMFRKLSKIEALHGKRILEEMGWPSLPALPAAFAWEEGAAPETAPLDAIHYLMQPYHALQLALQCEKRAQAHFKGPQVQPRNSQGQNRSPTLNNRPNTMCSRAVAPSAALSAAPV